MSKKIGIVTTGGDAPGMNAAIRAATRVATSENLEVVGFERGWEGIMTNTHRPLTARNVGGIIQLGGTILYTSRCPEFKQKKSIVVAAKNLEFNKIEGLIVIGGDGSMRAACELGEQTDAMIVGIPASIDNDVYGTDETIGFDTAANTGVTEIDKIRDTAISLERVFVVEVMGRTRGFLALQIGLTVGAEIILVPEVKINKESIFKTIKENSAKGKRSGIVVAAEGIGDTRELTREIEKSTGIEARLSILGYAQRGGSPTARSRFLASLFAEEAVKLIMDEQTRRVVGLRNGEVTSIELDESRKTKKPLGLEILKLAQVLAT